MRNLLNKPFLFFKKEGMSRFVDTNGDSFPVTILSYKDAGIVSVAQGDECDTVTIGYDSSVKENKISKSLKGFYQKNSSSLYAFVKTMKLKKGLISDMESPLSMYNEGDYVDVQGKTIGKGFAGGMKRHGFAGLRASHGVSISHRAHGSTGQCQDPGRVFKGKKMAGHMGDKYRTVQNLQIVEVNKEGKYIVVSGSIPGNKGSLVKVSSAVKLM